MKDEIKEILDELEDCKTTKYLNYNLDNKDARIILDYITNLQEENKRLKIEKQEEYNRFNLMAKFRDRALERTLIYKSRNEKATEYIKGWQSFPHTNGSTHNELRNLLNILEGDKDE